MNRRDFTKISALGSAGLVLTPLTPVSSLSEENTVVIWHWFGRLVVATVVKKVVEKAVDYVADRLSPREKKEAQKVIVNNNSYNYSPVYEYSPDKDNDFFVGKGKVEESDPSEVHFFSKDTSPSQTRRQCALLKKPEVAGLAKVSEEYRIGEGLTKEKVQNILLPRTYTQHEEFTRTSICIYKTRHAKMIITAELDDPYEKYYWIRIDIKPHRPMDHTRDLRYKPRLINYRDVLIL